MISFTEENYLKAAYTLSEKSGEVSVNELSKMRNSNMPTVNSMVKKLSEKGYLIYQSYKPVQLTEMGEKTALLIIRKHRLTEMFLVEKMGFGWEEVHEVAEQIEHIKSPKFFAKMDELLDYPTVDPHGSPIPDASGKIRWKTYETLDKFNEGDKLKLVAVNNSNDDFLRYLNSKSITLDIQIEVISREEFDQNMTVHFNGKTEVLSPKVTEKLLVEKL